MVDSKGEDEAYSTEQDLGSLKLATRCLLDCLIAQII